MRIPLRLLTVVVLGWGAAARGQIEVDCRLSRTRALLYEPIVATIRVVNNTGAPLRVGGEEAEARVGLDVEQTPGVPVGLTGESFPLETLVLGPGESRTFTVDLLATYKIRSTGPYTVRARVEWGEIAFCSTKVFLDVLPGFEVGRLTLGVPGGGRQTRTFSLRTLTRDREERLFLRVDDDVSGRILGVFELGRVVRQFKPQVEADPRGNVHILYQSSPWRFTHVEITRDGVPVDIKDFPAYRSEVRLQKTADGQLEVRGMEPPSDNTLFLPPSTLVPSGKDKKRR